MLNTENYIKFGTLVCSLSGLYFAIKSDIRDVTTEKRYEVEHLQYQITELKRCCNGTNDKTIVYNQPLAIMPKQLKELE